MEVSRRITGILWIQSEIHHVRDDLRVAHGLHGATLEAKRHLWSTILSDESRDNRVEPKERRWNEGLEGMALPRGWMKFRSTNVGHKKQIYNIYDPTEKRYVCPTVAVRTEITDKHSK